MVVYNNKPTCAHAMRWNSIYTIMTKYKSILLSETRESQTIIMLETTI